MANRVVKESYGNSQEILKINEFIAIPVLVDSDDVDLVNGKKILPAGSIVGGKTKARLSNPQEPVVDKLTPAVKASLKTGSTTSEIEWTAVSGGTAGNLIKVALIDPATATAESTVSVSGTTVTVTLKNTSGTAINATANEIVEIVNAHEEAKVLLSARATGTGLGTMAAKSATSLANGAAESVDENTEGVLLYDVDVTNGSREGAMVIYGYVDLDKVQEPNAAAVAALPLVTFLR